MVEKLDELNQIMESINNNKNFLLSGGAGSGKTFSLVQTINEIRKKYKDKTIACITYTNVAANEIKERTIDNKNLYVSTIHDFLWDNIKNFQNELKISLIKLINDGKIKYNNGIIDTGYFSDIKVQYKEYLKISEGIVSHDEVLLLANEMFKDYKVLSNILKDKYNFILVDEYQDTNKLVIEILLDFLKQSTKNNIIGFFGDSMQAIYDSGIGDLKEYIDRGDVIEIQKKQNRRNPLCVINLANIIRDDGLVQEPSDDLEAPNMKNGKIKYGDVKFLYSETDIDLRSNEIFKEWNFKNTDSTKELNLTHNLIATRAGFEELMNIYDKDPILKLKQELLKQVDNGLIDEEKTFGDIIGQFKHFVTKVNCDERLNELYNLVKDKKFKNVKNMFFSKDSLIDDKKMSFDEEKSKGRKRDVLIGQLFKIQSLMVDFENKKYNQFIRKTDFAILNLESIKEINKKMLKLKEAQNNTIGEVIDLADRLGICVKDDKFNSFVKDNDYIYQRVVRLQYSQFENLYNYLEGYTPFSTQHKVKGAEFDNVLVILDNGKWNQYNFQNLFTLSGSESVLKRTRKIFYVCCTRAKERLYVYYNKPSNDIIVKAREWFGQDNVIKIN